MTSLVVWTLAIGVVTAITCALCGVLLVVKREAFVSEGLSHSVLPGIILAYIVIEDRSSPLLVVAAGLSGMLMVGLVKAVSSTRLVDRDAALGIVFSALFSVGVIASSLKLGRVHFHAHCIIDGNLSFAALQHVQLGGVDLGPQAFLTMSWMLVILVAFITVFFKELTLMAFDEPTARLFGFRPGALHTVWLSLVAMTAVAAFETAGTILVVALMIAPAATGNLLTHRLSTLFVISGGIAALSAVIGIGLGIGLDIAPAGPIATVSGLAFLLVVMLRAGRTRWRNRSLPAAHVGQA